MMPKTSLRQESGPFSLDAASLITTPAQSVPLGLGSSSCLAAEFTRQPSDPMSAQEREAAEGGSVSP